MLSTALPWLSEWDNGRSNKSNRWVFFPKTWLFLKERLNVLWISWNPVLRASHQTCGFVTLSEGVERAGLFSAVLEPCVVSDFFQKCPCAICFITLTGWVRSKQNHEEQRQSCAGPRRAPLGGGRSPSLRFAQQPAVVLGVKHGNREAWRQFAATAGFWANPAAVLSCLNGLLAPRC